MLSYFRSWKLIKVISTSFWYDASKMRFIRNFGVTFLLEISFLILNIDFFAICVKYDKIWPSILKNALHVQFNSDFLTCYFFLMNFSFFVLSYLLYFYQIIKHSQKMRLRYPLIMPLLLSFYSVSKLNRFSATLSFRWAKVSAHWTEHWKTTFPSSLLTCN